MTEALEFKNRSLKPCALCSKESTLLLSHVLPAFIFRWLRDTSGTGHLRSTTEPNQRVQDGIKKYWLCADCEAIFGRSETAFANKLFHPYLKHSGGKFPYQAWLLRFCTSVSWRLLKHAQEDHGLQDWTQEKKCKAIVAEKVWREYLLGLRPNPGEHRQHLIPLDQLASVGRNAAPNINRYLMRAVHMDICQSETTLFTFGKLGRFIIIGHIAEANPERWKGSRIQANQGVVEPREFVLPSALWTYLNEKARGMSSSMDTMSPRQQKIVEETFRRNLDRLADSDAFKAMNADVNFFGDGAFRKD
ncbi:MAG: hypothetical protein Q7T70_16935 [Polaromonas sp.]|nr:hypothetical protein [Polaromonas sp.]